MLIRLGYILDDKDLDEARYCLTVRNGNSHIGKQNNQNFVNIPYGQLRNKLEYLCKLNDIVFVKQEESYTSKSSFWDRDDLLFTMPIIQKSICLVAEDCIVVYTKLQVVKQSMQMLTEH